MLPLEHMKPEQRAREIFMNSVRVGTILTASWGYDQTQVEFYEVMEVSGCTIHIQEVGHETVENKGWCSRSVVPDTANRIGPVIRKVVRSSSVKIKDYIRLTVWDGKPCYESWYA